MSDNVLQTLAQETGTKETDWQFLDGPDSRCGVDYWFENLETGQQAYVNWDQGEISVEILDSL